MSLLKLSTFRFTRVAFFLMIIVWFALGQGCAYYNTFYNTKKHFSAGERARSKTAEGQNVNTQDYKKCLETGSKLLELYPNSRWIDDCLLLMGKSYYWTNEYPRAQRKFEELVTNFPRSKHVPEARLWLAETLVKMGRGQDALVILEQLLATPKAKAFFAQGSFLAGNIHFDAERYADAADAYREAAQKFKDRDRRAESFYMLGRSLFMRKEYEKAKTAFDEIARLNPPRDLTYLGLVESGRCMAELGDTQGALELLDRLRRDIRFQDYSSEIDLTLAKIAAEKGDYDEAIHLYKQYLEENPNGEGKGEAYFRLGMIRRNHRRNLSAAAAYFDSSGSAGSGALADSAKIEAKILKRGLGYIHDMDAFETWIHYADSLLQIYPPISQETSLEPAPEPADSATEESPLIAEDTLVGFSVVSFEDSMLVDSSADAEEQLSEQLSMILLEDSSRKDTSSIIEEGLLLELSADSIVTDSTRVREIVPTDSSVTENDTITRTSSEPKLDFTMEEFWETKADLQKILFCIGEFYWYDLNDIDTAFIFFERAVRDTFDKETQWRSNLVLAELSKQRGADDTAIQPYYEAIMNLDGVPLEVENHARDELGLPQKAMPRDTLRERFLQLEKCVY
ncbi:tetratricopeptide repeat protein, partial [bacterium]|nr:tetratricopeptide repeat protein [bacterium]